MLNVICDGQVFLMQQRGGISRYFAALLGEFRTLQLGVSAHVPLRWVKNEHVVEQGIRGLRLPPAPLRRWGILRAQRPWVEWYSVAAGRLAQQAVLHSTYYHPDWLARRFRGPRVVTVYDMIPELMPGLFPRGNPHLAKRRYVEAADIVLSISESTRRDLLETYRDLRKPVLVTHLGVDERFSPAARRLAHLPERYVLFVGVRGSYKDFDVLVRAFAAAGLDRDCMLVAVGGEGELRNDEQTLIAATGLEGRVQQIAVSDDDLPSVYAQARCFVLPSRYEGFGLPALEAMACGTPAILAQSSSLPEVGGEAAAYFTPGNVDELAARLADVLGSEARRAELSRAGLARATAFSWRSCAIRTVEGYRAAFEMR